MTLPITIPNTFATATGNLSLSLLDANFTTVVNGINGIGNGTNSLATVSITGGNVALTALGYVGAANTAIVSNGTSWVSRTVPGTLTVGTSCVKNPYAIGTVTNQAHGLSATPDVVTCYLECLSAEYGYSVGDRIYMQGYTPTAMGTTNSGVWAIANSTTLSILIGPNIIYVADKNPANTTSQTITASKWKVVAVPYSAN